MNLVYWYIFWIILVIIVCIIVAFPGVSKCDNWFEGICKPVGSDFLFWAWLGVFVVLAIAGYYGDTNTKHQSIYRLFYGFLLTGVILWFLSLFGARNPITATFTALFLTTFSLSLVFLTQNTAARIIYLVSSLWFFLMVMYSYSIYQNNLTDLTIENKMF